MRTCCICGSPAKRKCVTCASPACQTARRSQVMVVRHAEAGKRISRPCAVCGKVFTFPRCEEGHRATCGPVCREAYRQQNAIQREDKRANRKTCTICGASFKSPPSDLRVMTCGRPACHATARAEVVPTPESIRLMLEGARRSPILQPDEHHINAKSWSLRAPDGIVYRFRNLKHFIRQNPGLFGRGEAAARAFAGLGNLSPDRKNQRGSWHGWTWAG